MAIDVTRKYQHFSASNLTSIKQQMLNLANGFNICCFLDNHHYSSPYNNCEALLAIGSIRTFTPPFCGLDNLEAFRQGDWMFGHFNFELFEHPSSTASDGFANFFLFVPQSVIILKKEVLTIGSVGQEPSAVLEQLLAATVAVKQPAAAPINIRSRVPRDEYIQIINTLQQHIRRGDCYEINYCHEYWADKAQIDPVQVYADLTRFSPNPFSAFYRVNDDYLLCASPERYINKKGNTLISQPIKGTWPRHPDPQTDETHQIALSKSQKEQSENVMVVDLVRNDLSKLCTPGTVKVDELFGIYPFPQVYQMISTISGEIAPEVSLTEVLRATFPMGSMTGAPKAKVLQLIRRYEQLPRGIFSGTLGYVTPNNHFDFNVVIRSIMYNSRSQHLSYKVGSGITAYSHPEAEWEECRLKAAAIEAVLHPQGNYGSINL